jgi:hypothetical protein
MCGTGELASQSRPKSLPCLNASHPVPGGRVVPTAVEDSLPRVIDVAPRWGNKKRDVSAFSIDLTP